MIERTLIKKEGANKTICHMHDILESMLMGHFDS
jgi:hypothetical protein